jgi:hypothetical protein
MAGSSDYGDAFREAKRKRDRQQQVHPEVKRLQAEADADSKTLSEVVFAELEAVSKKLKPLGGKVEIRKLRSSEGKRLTMIAFRIADTKEHRSPYYSIELREATVAVKRGDAIDESGRLLGPEDSQRGSRYPQTRGSHHRWHEKASHACDQRIRK